jgi:hypothetical protein
MTVSSNDRTLPNPPTPYSATPTKRDFELESDRQLEPGTQMRELVDVVSASQCRRQADLCAAEAQYEADKMVQTALRSMADQWLTLEKQIEWIAETRAARLK